MIHKEKNNLNNFAKEGNSSSCTRYKDKPFFLHKPVINSKHNLSVKQVITVLCRAKALKYTDLARKVGTSKQALNNYMNGSWGVPIQIKVKIAQVLGVDSSVIWDLPGGKEK